MSTAVIVHEVRMCSLIFTPVCVRSFVRVYAWVRVSDTVSAVGQWLVLGLKWSSSARQSLSAQQKELSE